MSDFREGFNRINIPGYGGAKDAGGLQKAPDGGRNQGGQNQAGRQSAFGRSQGGHSRYGGDAGYNGGNRPEGLPEGYLKGGYFENAGADGQKRLRKELILVTARDIAVAIANAKPELATSQMRKYFDYARNIGEKLRQSGGDYRQVEADVAKLVPFATDAKNKRKIPDVFYDFIIANVSAVHGADDFTKGFLEHFQAVIAYYNPKKG